MGSGCKWLCGSNGLPSIMRSETNRGSPVRDMPYTEMVDSKRAKLCGSGTKPVCTKSSADNGGSGQLMPDADTKKPVRMEVWGGMEGSRCTQSGRESDKPIRVSP